MELRSDVGGSVRTAADQCAMDARSDPTKVRQEVINEHHWHKLFNRISLRASRPCRDSRGDHALDRKPRIPQVPEARDADAGDDGSMTRT